MRHRVTFMATMGALILGAAEAPGQEAGESVGKRIVNWLGIPESTRAHDHRGVVWDKKGEFDKAIVEFSEAIRLDPSNTRVYFNRGVTWAKKGEFDKAIADFTDAIRLDPKQAWPYGDRACVIRAHIERAKVWSSKNEYDKSIADCTEAIRLDLSNTRAYYNRGDAWEEKGEHDKAITDYTEAIRLDPQEAMAHAYRAWLWATCPDPGHRDGPAAVTSAIRACELSGWKEAYHLGTLAAAYAEVGNFDAAVKWQESALEQYESDKDSEPARARLALYRERQPYREEPVAK